ncbi:putative urea ABC transporter substrate-binding protein [Vibrio spartinae]|uniref:Aliphatic sulfonates-binding protein n=1 Tax=Vibrio spartinae TaxID=1918945 RepID=A0A1N6M7X1_9VIBR|nr:putative urea ABC transporter substrate-binding protein [Vibrio spartinae]QMV12827.1 Putative aliphatic sulfonates-binding protein precursor [Vibrio spartinae]SIO95535.1 Putative aliphatic sulfonates-binding protein precursor [Vibrio spartinae]
MKLFLKPYLTALVLSVTLVSSLTLSRSVSAEEKSQFTLAWSIYVGWMPWDYADSSGILKKWADKYGIQINVVQVNDYVESINQYTAGQFDATVMTNMDALTIPAASGVDSTALIVGDFSAGNDGIVLKGDHKTLADIKGQNINLVELSVSHYLMARALEVVGLSEQDVHVVNTSDADIVAAYQTQDVTSVVTWNPLLSEITAQPHTSLVFDSTKIPGEIIDLLVANTQTLRDNPKFAKALTGAWYEVMSVMKSPQADAAKTMMAKASGTNLAGYNTQLQATQMFFSPADAVQFTDSDSLMETMQKVAQFSFDHGLLGDGAPDASFIGIETPAGVFGNADNIKLRFNSTYMQMAAEHKL